MKKQESKNRESNYKPCVYTYCGKSTHKTSQCEAGISFENVRCFSCKCKHHVSICDCALLTIKANALLATKSSTVTYPAIIVAVKGVKCRA